MLKTRSILTVCLLLLAGRSSVALAQGALDAVGVRYSAQISNGSAGNCGCFALQGVAMDAAWKALQLRPALQLDLAADLSVQRTGNENGAGYGLTLASYTLGPRLAAPMRKAQMFAQVLLGGSHASNSQFPQANSSLGYSANSMALYAGGGFDYPLQRNLSLRLLQVDYLYTQFPNNVNGWQNNLRLGAGITLRMARHNKK